MCCVSATKTFVLAVLLLTAAVGYAQTTPDSRVVERQNLAITAPETVPPRTVTDLLSILDEYKPDPAHVNRLRAELAKTPPETDDKIELRRFYASRAEAAGELGFLAQQLADLRKAITFAPPGDSERWALYIEVAHAEQQAGNYARAVEMWNEALSSASSGGAALGAYTAMTGNRASYGDLAGAREALKGAESTFSELRRQRNAARYEDNWRALLANARGRLLRAEGKYLDAEVALRDGLLHLDRYIENYPELPDSQRYSTPSRIQKIRQAISWGSGLGSVLLDEGKFLEAELVVRRLLKRSLETFGKYSPETGSVVAVFAHVLYEYGRFEESAALFMAAIEIYGEIGAAPHSATLTNSLRGLAETQVEYGRYIDADRTFSRRRAGLMENPDSAKYLGIGSLSWVYALVKLGRAEQAVTQANEIYARQRAFHGDEAYVALEARAFRALALAAADRDQEALREFRSTVPGLLTAAAENATDEGVGVARALRLKRILEAYMGLLARYATRGDPTPGLDPAGTAFLLADVARSSTVQRALTAATARAAIRDPELARLAREEQDAAQRIGSLRSILSELLARSADKQLPDITANMRQDIESLRATRARVRKDIEQQFPDYASLVDPRPVSLETARKALLPGEALIVLYGVEDSTFAWAVPKEGSISFARVALPREERERMVRVLRGALDVGPVSLEQFPEFDVDVAFKLFAKLFAPLESSWGSARTLLVVPHGALAQLPFTLLVTKPGAPTHTELRFAGYRSINWLIQRVAVIQLPSVNTLTSLRSVKRAQLPLKPFIGFGDPIFARDQLVATDAIASRSVRLRSALYAVPATRGLNSVHLDQLARLPDTAEELEGIARAIGVSPQSNVFVQLRASEQVVKETDLSDRRVIAFATHGLVPGDLDGLMQPALALSNPQLTGERDADGILTMEEILRLRLNADWVVLSACNTAAAGNADEEALSGLGRAFFYAGARALLVSNWPVETVSARLLTTGIFQRETADSKITRAEALRQSMFHVMQDESAKDGQGKPLFSYAHPMFWAPFSLVGDGN